MAAAEGTPGTLGTAVPPPPGPPSVPPPVPPPGPLPPVPPLECSGDDAQAMGRDPLPVLRQILAACAFPDLLESPALPEAARSRARSVLREMDAGNIGGYNHEHRSHGVPARVSRFLEFRDGGVPCDPRDIVLCSGTTTVIPIPGLGRGRGRAAPGSAGSAEPLPPQGAVGGQPRGPHGPRAEPAGHGEHRPPGGRGAPAAAGGRGGRREEEVHQERAFSPERPFLSFKRVLAELGAPLATSVQLVSFYSLSKSAAGESGFRAGFLELVNVDEGVRQPFQLAQSIPRPCVPGRILLDLLMELPEEGDPVRRALEEHRRDLCRDLAANARRLQEELGRAPGIRCQPLAGGPRAFPRIRIPPRARSQARPLRPLRRRWAWSPTSSSAGGCRRPRGWWWPRGATSGWGGTAATWGCPCCCRRRRWSGRCCSSAASTPNSCGNSPDGATREQQFQPGSGPGFTAGEFGNLGLEFWGSGSEFGNLGLDFEDLGLDLGNLELGFENLEANLGT
ncbi:alanine aminotransferase 1-like [Corvus hawaiiensis]|uniref:alanine aminotransferase 1-like n=1 Tax=Corvus hawaiiensis TaxID=134902 RepID=UPI002018A961|nr:alanine aminotransferase 1-like [Corvus hawaiiensis]